MRETLAKINLLLLRTTIKGAVVLLPLLGITWVIGLFAVNENTIVFAWLFTVINSLQVSINTCIHDCNH